MINPKWDRWIFSSVGKHFSDNLGSLYKIFIEGMDYIDLKQIRIDLRMAGPNYIQLSKVEWKVEIIVNLLINFIKDDKNIYAPNVIAGEVAKYMTNIDILEYGDSGNYLACLKRDDAVRVTPFGQIDPKTKLMQTMVEADFETYLLET